MLSTLLLIVSLFSFSVQSTQARSVKLLHGKLSDEIVNKIHVIEEYQGWDLVEDFDIVHHFARMRHDSPELTINVTLVNLAKQAAVVYAWYEGEPPYHEDENDVEYGYNYHYHGNPEDRVTPSDVFEVWYRQGEAYYDYDRPIATNYNVEFLRIVSKSTKEYGCGQARSKGIGGGIFTVCYYWPEYQPGNEAANIGRPLYSFDDNTFDKSTLDDLKKKVMIH